MVEDGGGDVISPRCSAVGGAVDCVRCPLPGIGTECEEAGTTLADRVGHSQLVLSLESMQRMSADAVQKLLAGLRMGVVVYDELHSAAQNHGTTDPNPLVSAPASVADVLCRVNQSAEFVVAMEVGEALSSWYKAAAPHSSFAQSPL